MALAENPKSNVLLDDVGSGISSKSKGFETNGAFSSTKSESIIVKKKWSIMTIFYIRKSWGPIFNVKKPGKFQVVISM